MKKFIIACCLMLVSLASYANVRDHGLDQFFENFVKKQHIDSMSVGINQGKKHWVIQHGNEKRYPINSMTKTFTTFLLAYYSNTGQIHLMDRIDQYFHQLENVPIGQAQLINFATHTTGLPLQINPPLYNRTDVFNYLKHWEPVEPIGSRRIYSNLGIGMVGYVLENVTKKSYADLLNKVVFHPYGMTETSVNPPEYDLLPRGSVFMAADGIVSTAKDMNAYLRMMMEIGIQSEITNKAVNSVLTGYFQTPFFMTGLGWQAYPWPIDQKIFLKSSSLAVLNTRATAVRPPLKIRRNQLFIRTGAGHGFTSIMGMIPGEKISVVILMHKNTALRTRMAALYDSLKMLK